MSICMSPHVSLVSSFVFEMFMCTVLQYYAYFARVHMNILFIVSSETIIAQVIDSHLWL